MYGVTGHYQWTRNMKMRTPALLVALAMLTACGEPAEMNRATAQEYSDCMDKGWVPTYFSNGMKTEVSCKPNREPMPMNDATSKAFQACLAKKDTAAAYDGKTGHVACVKEGTSLQMR